MCQILPARVVGVNGQEAQIELHGGMLTRASLALHPEVTVGQYVLFDRGVVLEVLEPAEAAAIIAMYEEIGQLLEEADAAQWLSAPSAAPISTPGASP